MMVSFLVRPKVVNNLAPLLVQLHQQRLKLIYFGGDGFQSFYRSVNHVNTPIFTRYFLLAGICITFAKWSLLIQKSSKPA